MTDFKAMMHQFRFRFPTPLGEAYSAAPDPLAGFGAALRQWEGWDGEEEERGGEGEGRGSGGEGKGGPQVTVEPGPLRALLRHWEPPLQPATPIPVH